MDTETVLDIIATLDAKINLYTVIAKTNHDAITYNKYELNIAIKTLEAFRNDLQEGIIEPLVTQAENALGE
jgi:tetrahydromethanopterin S-methyltransferase subunit B